jgi:hypothetical protein
MFLLQAPAIVFPLFCLIRKKKVLTDNKATQKRQLWLQKVDAHSRAVAAARQSASLATRTAMVLSLLPTPLRPHPHLYQQEPAPPALSYAVLSPAVASFASRSAVSVPMLETFEQKQGTWCCFGPRNQLGGLLELGGSLPMAHLNGFHSTHCHSDRERQPNTQIQQC